MAQRQELIRSDAETGELKEGVFLKLSECPPEFSRKFYNVLEAIKNGAKLNAFKTAVHEMKEIIVSRGHCLDVCEMVHESRKSSRKRHPMTLLAFAGYYGRKDMLNFLIHEGAHVDLGNKALGTPLLQMLKYAQIQQKQHQLDIDIVQCLIDAIFDADRAALSRVLTAGTCENCTALAISINLPRFDIAERLIRVGVDPIYGGDPNMRPIFLEYVQFGTNVFIKWLLGYYHERGEIPAFVRRLLDGGVFSREETNHTAKIFGRNVVHTFLLSGHSEAIRLLAMDKRANLLEKKDPSERSALHLAAEMGDSDTVEILLDRNADIDAEDVTSMTPLMLATKNGHVEVMKLLLVKLVEITAGATDGGELPRKSNPIGLWSWALQYEYPAYFEAMHQTKELEKFLISPLDNDDNTIAHLAAEGGNISVFKSTFPSIHWKPMFGILNQPNKQMKTPLQLAIKKGNIGILRALQEHRADRKKQVSTVDLHQQQAEAVEKREWKEFWVKESPGLLLYASLRGTVDTVMYFVTKLVPPTTRLNGKTRYTPLSCAAKAGNHEIVDYLLSIKDVSAEGVEVKKVPQLSMFSDNERPYSPLMLASKYGYAKCVTLLLAKNADITVKSKRRYNCLMECISAGHKDVAVAILTHHDQWNDSKTTMKACEEVKGQLTTPMRMLIEKMPDVAEIVLTKCTSKGTSHGGCETGTKKIVYNFEFIDDNCEAWKTPAPADTALQVQYASSSTSLDDAPIITSTASSTPMDDTYASSSTSMDDAPGIISTASSTPADDALRWLKDEDEADSDSTTNINSCNPPHPSSKQCDAPSHPLTLMVSHKHLDLLQHPLISCYIKYKWWNVVFILFFLYILIHGIFLIFLTSFALSLPRPGPDNDFCPSNNSGSTYSELKLRDGDCREPDGVERRAFTAMAVILLLMSLTFLAFEVSVALYSYIMQQRNIVDYEVVIRVGAFLLTIIFVFGFWNECWCAPPWQWQIGAFAILLADINFILLFKRIPRVGINISMLFNIVITFLELIYLPVFLIFSFAIPFYMLFVRDGDAVLGNDGPGILEAFSTPLQSIAKTFIQTTGSLDYDTIFIRANLLYSPMAYIIFISFVILMPILFRTMLVGLAVRITETDKNKATFTNLQLQVNFILTLKNFEKLLCWGRFPLLDELPCLESIKGNRRNVIVSFWDKLIGLDYKSQKKMFKQYIKGKNKINDSKEDVHVLKERVTKLTVTLQEKVPELEKSHKQLQQSLQNSMQALQSNLQAQHDSMQSLQRDVKEILKKREKVT